MEESISKKISSFKWFLTIGMVLYHSTALNPYNVLNNSLIDNILINVYEKFTNHLGYISMVFFFFISGFFLYYKAENGEDITSKMKKRIKTLLIPYILWTIIIIIYKKITSNIYISCYNICDILFFNPIVGALWYLLALLLLMVPSPAVIKLKKEKKIISILFALIALFSILINFNIINQILNYGQWWWLKNIFYYLPIYLLGSYIGMYYPKIVLKNKYENKSNFILGLVLIFISTILWIKLDNSKFYTIYSLIELIGFWFVLKSELFNKKVPSYYYSSFFIYALHSSVLIPQFYSYAYIIFNEITINVFQMIVLKVIELLYVIIVSYLLSLLAKKVFGQRIYNGLTGGR